MGMGIIGIRKAEAGSSGHAHLPPASWGRRTALLLLSLCLTSCSLSLTSCSEVLSKDVAAPKGQPASPDLNPETKPKEESKPKAASYAAALRQGDFVAAKKAFLEATPAERAHPEVLYAEAQVALELGDVESALKNAALLEEGAPLFRAEAQDLRLRAARMSQDVTLLEHFLGESKTRTSDAALGDRLILAEAYQHGASIREALELTDGCLAVLAKRKKPGKQEQRLEAQTRLLRAKLFVNLDQDENAAREYRWLANQGVTEPEALDADARAEQLDPKRPLTAAQRFDRAKAFSEQGLLERTDQELRQLKKAPGTRPTEAETDAVLAWAVYASRSDYKRAAELFAKAAKAGGEDRRKHLYYAAKSLARAHEDEAAIKGYQALAALGGTYGEHASYQAPHLLFMSGKLAQALAGYEDYLKRFRSGGHRDHGFDACFGAEGLGVGGGVDAGGFEGETLRMGHPEGGYLAVGTLRITGVDGADGQDDAREAAIEEVADARRARVGTVDSDALDEVALGPPGGALEYGAHVAALRDVHGGVGELRGHPLGVGAGVEVVAVGGVNAD